MLYRLKFSDKREAAEFIHQNNIRIVNLCHIPEDGKLKTLSFSATDSNRVEEILQLGERADGSSLFSFIEPGRSDIYLQPDLKKAFVHPFSALPTMNILCNYLDENGKPLAISPQNVLSRAESRLSASAGLTLRAFAELEFYIILNHETEPAFHGPSDGNYHDSMPFSRAENIRNEAISVLEDLGLPTKYAHSEVGRLSRAGTTFEQHEIEFAPQGLADAAEAVAIGKWVTRNVCAKHGAQVSFSPKISIDHAGTGMHVHLCGLKDGRNVISTAEGKLSDEAMEMMGGILEHASSLAGFVNPTPVSYLRFIARKESPMHICWSVRNRLALIRVPLWWTHVNRKGEPNNQRETFEYRAPDAFANPYLLLAGIAVASDCGLSNPVKAKRLTEELRADDGNSRMGKFAVLPRSCAESAKELHKDRKHYEEHGVFPTRLIDETISKLESWKDADLWQTLAHKPERFENLLKKYLHYG
jgi:glutamine synthetase